MQFRYVKLLILDKSKKDLEALDRAVQDHLYKNNFLLGFQCMIIIINLPYFHSLCVRFRFVAEIAHQDYNLNRSTQCRNKLTQSINKKRIDLVVHISFYQEEIIARFFHCKLRNDTKSNIFKNILQ